jgi:hypothetical protein
MVAAGSVRINWRSTLWASVRHITALAVGDLTPAGRIPEIDVALQIEPELRRYAKELARLERHLGTHGATLTDQLDCRLPGHPCRLRENRYAQEAWHLRWITGLPAAGSAPR